MSRRTRYSRYDAWPPYVPVAERRAKAQREVAKQNKKGQHLQPVVIAGRAIAHSFWGKGWCTHLESFGDYSNRLPRGRSYVRNGAVCHLAIGKGVVGAKVVGSRMYQVQVAVKPLSASRWSGLKVQCSGKIGSLIELLQGHLSDEIMRTVTDREKGLFPRQGEIEYTCSCPDWASMCKHVSAVMYGIGARLDEQPELLFLLRGVDHEELIATGAAAGNLAGSSSRRARRRVLSGPDLTNVFGVELDDVAAAIPLADAVPVMDTPTSSSQPARPAKTRRKRQARAAAPLFRPTARSVKKLRKQAGLSRAEFARTVGVSTATVANWENAKVAIKPNAKSLKGLQALRFRLEGKRGVSTPPAGRP